MLRYSRPHPSVATLTLLAAVAVMPLHGQQRSAAPATPATAAARGTLDLASALALAADRSPALARIDARASMANGDVRASAQWPNPTLEYRRENLGAPILPDEFITAYIPIDVTGRRVQLFRASARGQERIAAERLSARRDMQLEIASAWVRAASAADLTRATQRQLDAVADVARIEETRAAEGAVAEAVAFRTRIEADRVLHRLSVAASDEADARVVLATLMGVPPDSFPPLASLMDTASPFRAGAAIVDGAPSIGTGDAAAEDAQLLVLARRDRLSLRAAELSREETALRQRVEQRGVLGDWQLQGGTKRTSGFMTGQVGLALPLPLFNQNGAAREKAEGAVRESEAVARSLALQIDGEVRAASARLRRLLSVGSRMAQTARLGEQVAESARIAWSEGHMTLVELLDAQRAFADAESTARQYRGDLLLAHLALARAIGAPLIPENTP